MTILWNINIMMFEQPSATQSWKIWGKKLCLSSCWRSNIQILAVHESSASQTLNSHLKSFCKKIFLSSCLTPEAKIIE